MNYERMWNQLKADLVERVDDMKLSQEARNNFKSTIIQMNRIETQEAKEKSGQEYTVKQDITGNVDIKASLLEKSAKKLFEQITGHKVINSLEKLKSEMQKRRGKTPFSNQETIVVDECVDIPDDIWNEAAVHGIKIARFGIDVISSDEIPKGMFLHKEVFPGTF